jgi:hypothetical protein
MEDSRPRRGHGREITRASDITPTSTGIDLSSSQQRQFVRQGNNVDAYEAGLSAVGGTTD